MVGSGIFFFFFCGNFGGGELVFVAKFWWKLETVGLLEREKQKGREERMNCLFYLML